LKHSRRQPEYQLLMQAANSDNNSDRCLYFAGQKLPTETGSDAAEGKFMRRLIGRFVKDERGIVLVETLIAVPVLTLVMFGIMEFGSLMWQRQQLQVGVRDAARYWSRCDPSFSSGCTLDRAMKIAFYGNPEGTGVVRVPEWDNLGDTTELVITPALPPAEPTAGDIVRVTGKVIYQGTPLYDAVFGFDFEIGYFQTMRYQGW